MSGREDPALEDELTSIKAYGEGRSGEAAGPEDEDVALTPEESADIEEQLKSSGENA